MLANLVPGNWILTFRFVAHFEEQIDQSGERVRSVSVVSAYRENDVTKVTEIIKNSSSYLKFKFVRCGKLCFGAIW